MFDGIDPCPEVRIHLGDYRDALGHVCADLILTSPPYNIGTQGPRQDGHRKRGKYDPKSFAGVDGYADKMQETDYQDSQVAFLAWARDHITKNGTIVYNHKPRRKLHAIIHPMTWISRVPGLVLAEEVIWDRESGHNHDQTMMWPQTERLYVLRRTEGRYCLKNTRATALPYNRDIWRIGRAEQIGHCAAFPLSLAEAAIKAWSKPGHLVVDPYSGSGTTAVAARNLGRRFEGSEILQKYYDIAIGRL